MIELIGKHTCYVVDPFSTIAVFLTLIFLVFFGLKFNKGIVPFTGLFYLYNNLDWLIVGYPKEKFWTILTFIGQLMLWFSTGLWLYHLIFVFKIKFV